MALINADQLDCSPPDWLVDGIIPRVGTGFFWGPRWWGKSLVTDNELALAVANGTGFLGHKTVHGSVALCLGEGLYDAGVRMKGRQAREQRDRLAEAEKIAARQGPETAQAWLAAQPAYDDERVFVWTEPFSLPVVRADGGAELSRSVRSFITAMSQVDDLELVILDSFSDFAGGLSISNDASANRLVQGMKGIMRELDCFVLAVAHPTEKGDKMIGAGRLGNAADWVARIEPETDTAPDAPKAATIVCEKNKYGGPFDPMTYQIEPLMWFEPATDEDGNLTGQPPVPVSSATVRLREDDPDGGGLRLPGRGERRAAQLPEVTGVPARPRKRNGIRPGGTFRTIAAPASGLAAMAAGLTSGPAPYTAPPPPPVLPKPQPVLPKTEPPLPVPEPVLPQPEPPLPEPSDQSDDAAQRAALVAALISVDCPRPDCGKGPGESCVPGGTGTDYVWLDRNPVTVAHVERLGVAVARGKADLDTVLAQFNSGDKGAARLAEATA